MKKSMYSAPILLILALLFGIAMPTPSEKLKEYMAEYQSLAQAYAQHPNDSLAQALEHSKAQLIVHIHEHGYPVELQKLSSSSVAAIKQTPSDALHITTLRHGDSLYIFERVDQAWVRVQTFDGVEGYLEHSDFSPSLESFPLNLLAQPMPDAASHYSMPQQPLKAELPPTAAQPSYETSPSSSASSEGCSTRRCSAHTQKGYQCRRNTTNCNGRCWQH